MKLHPKQTIELARFVDEDAIETAITRRPIPPP